MKRLLFVMFFCFSILVYPQEIQLQLKDPSLKQIIEKVEKQTDFKFAYNDKIDTNLQLSGDFNYQNLDLAIVLDKLSKQTSYDFEIINNNITIIPRQASTKDQIQKVEGLVTDESGLRLAGATVVEKGTSNGVITDFDGKFSIQVANPNASLEVSFIGYLSKIVSIPNNKSLSIILEQDPNELEEITVTALGIKREEKALGYSVQKVGGEALQKVKGVDVGTSLTGKVAGLLVQNSSEFTAEPEIFIRGEEPLLVIDGVPYNNMTLRDIPSDDIKSIDVLKGATASALYGYRGASGAIMITTLKGEEGAGLSVSFNSSAMFTAGYLAIPETQSVYGRKVNTGTNQYNGAGQGSWGVPLEGQEVIQWDPVSKTYQAMPYLPIGANNFKNYLEQGYILNNNIGITQKGKNGNLRSSVTWVENKGQYPNSKFDKLTYNLSGDLTFGNFSLSSSLAYNKQNSPNIGFSGYTGYDPMYNILIWSSPDYDIRDYKDYWLVENESQNSSYTSTNNNPYFDRYERLHKLDRDIFNGFVSGTYQFKPWLKATFRTGYDNYSNRQEVRISKGSFQGGGSATVIKNGRQVWGESRKGSYNVGLGRGYSLNNDLIITGEQELGKFNFDALAGGTLFYTQDEGIESRTTGGLSIPGFYSLNASINPTMVNSSLRRQQVNSLYGRLAISWDNLAFVEGTLRNDWSSTLPETTRSYLYPSVSSSFILSELLPSSEWLSYWKIRGSWTSSKTPAGVYDINTIYNINTNAWGDLSSAIYPDVIRGNEVRPESSATFELGTKLSTFSNRISLDLTYYNKRMYDFLRATSISPASGYTGNFVNTNEEITRKGLELAASITPVKTSDFQWDLTINWSKYARYYTQIDEEFSPDQPWVEKGKRVDHYTLREFLKNPEGEIIFNNGLPQYSAYSSLYGYSDPDWIWGLGSQIRYRNFSLNIAADGRVGGLAQTTTEMYMWNSGNHPNSLDPARYLDATEGTANYIGDGVMVVSGEATYDTYGNITSDDRVYAPNDVAVTYENYIKRIHKGTAWGGSPSPLDIYSTTFLKLREVALTYNFSDSLNDFIGTKSASISAIGQNLLLWAKDFKYSDPDGGRENFSDPSQRFIGANLNLTF